MKISRDNSYVKSDLDQLNKLMSNLKLSNLSDDTISKLDESIHRTIELIEGVTQVPVRDFDRNGDEFTRYIDAEYNDFELAKWIIQKYDHDLEKIISEALSDHEGIEEYGYGDDEYDQEDAVETYIMENSNKVDEDLINEYIEYSGDKEDAIESWEDRNDGFDPWTDLPAPWR